jgi:multidrug efflux pump subunit AcrB
MKRFLFVLVLIVAGAVGLAFYLGWFHVASDSAGDKSHITITMDKDKIQEDEKKVQQKVQDLGHSAKGGTEQPTEKSKDQAEPPVQPPRD